jgi:hypothetical protein
MQRRTRLVHVIFFCEVSSLAIGWLNKFKPEVQAQNPHLQRLLIA